MEHKRKGQAAMEFLMTYGWAILAAIIAIGVLAYFGVFNPAQVAGSTGVIRAPFNLDAYNVDTNGVNLEITQNSGQSLNVTSLLITGTGPSSGTTCTGAADADIGVFWTSGNRTTVNALCTPAPLQGDSFAGDVAIIYYESGSALAQTTTGSVRDTVQ